LFGYEDPNQAIRDIVNDDNKIRYENIDLQILLKTQDCGFHPNTIFINIEGCFDLIMRSTLPIARKFKRTLMFDIIPSIIQHGFYVSPGVADHQLKELQHRIENEQQERQRLELQLQQLPMLDIVFQNRIKNNRIVTEYVYILTSNMYLQIKVFKIGISTNVSKRLVSLNTANVTVDQQLYICDQFECSNAKYVEGQLLELLHDFRYNRTREFVVFNYLSLKKLVECACNNNHQLYDTFNDIVAHDQTQIIPIYTPPKNTITNYFKHTI
jgi:prophage antirepressor-like protein